MNSLGERIRATRTERKLTLKQVSQKTSLSISFISEVERDKANPSISTLKRIANALDVNFTDLFGDKDRHTIVRKHDRKSLVHSEGSRITWYALNTGSNNKMGAICGILEEGATSGVTGVGHSEGEEFLMVLSGQIEFVLGHERFILDEGDAIYYDATVPHHYRNLCKGDTNLLAVASPPTF